MSVTVEDFLEHHGVKGQHWGIKNVKQDLKDLKTKINKNKKLKVGLEIGGGVAAAATIATGAIIADRLIRQHSAMKATDLRTLWSKGKLMPPLPSKAMGTPISALPKTGGLKKLDLKLYSPKNLKALKSRTEKVALKPGSKTSISDVNSAIANVAKATAQTAKSTKRGDVVKFLKSVRIGVGPA